MSTDNDIIGDEFFESVVSDKTDSKNLDIDVVDVVEENILSTVNIASDLPKLIGDNYPVEYQLIVKRLLDLYSDLPRLNYNELHSEVEKLNADSTPTPTLPLINLKLQSIQAHKDRLAEIYQKVVRCYTFKKRVVNILSEAWGKFADGSSADKRKADCAFRLSDFYIDLAQIESLHFACEHALRNLDSASNAISRQITIIQSELKIFDIGRGALPDFDFNKSSLNDSFESLGVDLRANSDIAIDPAESKEAEEISF